MSKKRILIAALNWGLGHATRSIPIIDALLKANVEVVLASDGDALALWQREYPKLKTIELPSYQVHYKYQNMFVNMGLQLPKFLNVIHKERQFIESIISKYKIDALISDNRYGVYHPDCPSVFLSHQVRLKIPNILISKAVNQLNKYILNKFDQIWVPDYKEEESSLSGELSHRHDFTAKTHYLGPLSRLKQVSDTTQISPYPIVALLSGPEPQRSYFETALKQELQKLEMKSLIIQGKPQANNLHSQEGQVSTIPFLNGSALSAQLQAAELVIARSGYSSIMDFAQLGLQQLLYVPTPGQSEQIYLARRAHQQGVANWQKQQQLNLKEAWQNRQKFKGYAKMEEENHLAKAIQKLLNLKK